MNHNYKKYYPCFYNALFYIAIWLLIFFCVMNIYKYYVIKDGEKAITSIMPNSLIGSFESLQDRREVSSYYSNRYVKKNLKLGNENIYQLDSWPWLIHTLERNKKNNILENYYYPVRIYTNGCELNENEILNSLNESFEYYKDSLKIYKKVTTNDVIISEEKIRSLKAGNKHLLLEIKSKFPERKNIEYIVVDDYIVVAITKRTVERHFTFEEGNEKYFYYGAFLFVVFSFLLNGQRSKDKYSKSKLFLAIFTLMSSAFYYSYDIIQNKIQYKKINTENYDDDMYDFYPALEFYANQTVILKGIEANIVQEACNYNNIHDYISRRINALYFNDNIRYASVEVYENVNQFMFHKFVHGHDDKIRKRITSMCKKVISATLELYDMDPFDIENEEQRRQFVSKCKSLENVIRNNLNEIKREHNYNYY